MNPDISVFHIDFPDSSVIFVVRTDCPVKVLPEDFVTGSYDIPHVTWDRRENKIMPGRHSFNIGKIRRIQLVAIS